MTWHLDWASFIVGVLATWAGSALFVCALARRRPQPGDEQRRLDALTLRALDAELEEFRRQEGLA